MYIDCMFMYMLMYVYFYICMYECLYTAKYDIPGICINDGYMHIYLYVCIVCMYMRIYV